MERRFRSLKFDEISNENFPANFFPMVGQHLPCRTDLWGTFYVETPFVTAHRDLCGRLFLSPPATTRKVIRRSKSMTQFLLCVRYTDRSARIYRPSFHENEPKCSFSVIGNERFGLVFVKTGSINSGAGV